jgi:FAD binding domain
MQFAAYLTRQVAARDLVAGSLDINGATPRRFFLEVLQHFAESPVEAERLQYLASPEGRDDMYRYNQREGLYAANAAISSRHNSMPRHSAPAQLEYAVGAAAGRTVLEVLQDFPSARPPLEWLLQTVPRLRPRLFSISSALAAAPTQAHITAAIVDWVTPFKRRRQVRPSCWITWGLLFHACGWHEAGTGAWLPGSMHSIYRRCAGGVHIMAGSAVPAAGGGAGAGVGRARRVRAACRPGCPAHTGGTRHRCRALPSIPAAPAADRR